MKGLGLVARADRGGLAAMTYEQARHLQPERVLLVCLRDESRGAERPERYHELDCEVTEVDYRRMTVDDLRRFATGLDTVVTAETWYVAGGAKAVQRARARAVLIAMPELYENGGEDLVIVPTEWEMDRIPNAVLLPNPVALDRFPEWTGPKDRLRSFYHPASGAMMDRNGTGLVLAALPHVNAECAVIIHCEGGGGAGPVQERIGQVIVRRSFESFAEYPDQYPPLCGALLLPRRFAGMSLPVQESAALGWPAIMIDVDPQWAWPHVVPTGAMTSQPGHMKGGTFDVWDGDPEHLAAVMTDMVTHDAYYREVSTWAREWAESRSWEALLPEWEKALT